MNDWNVQKKMFDRHVATFTDYGNIKILDFRRPDSITYRIRFLFEEDYYKLHISGDLGELTATNYRNMTFERFSDFANNPGYFEKKIDCMSRSLYFYDYDKAKDDLKEFIEEAGLEEAFENEYADVDEAIDYILEYFDDMCGISRHGFEIMESYYPDFCEVADRIGKTRTGILELYMLAFRLAMEQLERRKMGKWKFKNGEEG